MEIFNIVNNSLQYYLQWKNNNLSELNLMKLFYLECKLNLSVLDTINLNSKKYLEKNVNLIKLINLLKTDILSTIVLTVDNVNQSNENINFANFLFNKIKENILLQKYKNNSEEFTLIKSITFLNIKINTLKLLSGEINNESLKKINVVSRINNIKIILLLVVNKLVEYDGLSNISFSKEEYFKSKNGKILKS